uniref:Neurotransmitter-gated ion-channel ligand-binding domain-containing protein n=1 Tax=Anopheles minimus TaxID=112268 RepID=A0A182WA68_9DIPT
MQLTAHWKYENLFLLQLVSFSLNLSERIILLKQIRQLASITCNKETSNVENSLKQHLFCNGYDPTVRPAKSEFDMINITMVPYVHDFDYSWNDTSLQWNATDWSNITMLRPNNDEIWFPEFEHINSDYEGDPSHTCSNPHCVLLSKGSLICLPVCKTSAKCLPDYSNWPFNTVTCTMWFANRDKELLDEINFVIDKKFIATRGNAATANWCLTGFTSDKTVLNIPGIAGQTVWLWKFGLQHTPHTALATVYFPTFVPGIACIDCNKTTSNVENSLKQHLFCNGYDPKIRPAKSEFDTINITAVALLNRFGVLWQDPSLQWNASDWSNITILSPNNDEIWLPQFEHINSAYVGVSSLSCTNPQCLLFESGKLACDPSCILSAKCTTDYSRWPFNTMNCRAWFSTYDKELVDEINFLPFHTVVSVMVDSTSANWCMTSFESNATILNIPGATSRNAKELQITLVVLNIFICWLNSLASVKTKIVLISLMCHFRLIHDVLFLSTEVPDSVLFVIASMAMTLLLFVITLVLRRLHALHATPPRVITLVMQWLKNNRMMDWFLQTKYLSLGHVVIHGKALQ